MEEKEESGLVTQGPGLQNIRSALCLKCLEPEPQNMNAYLFTNDIDQCIFNVYFKHTDSISNKWILSMLKIYFE
jgi:hypothetical protein